LNGQREFGAYKTAGYDSATKGEILLVATRMKLDVTAK
jgi:hypothetical protein